MIMDQLENTMVPCKTTLSTHRLFNGLTKYPISNEIIRYPKTSDGKYLEKITIHDMIYANLNALVPNIDIGYQMQMDKNDLIEWVKKSKEYSNQLAKDFAKRCELKIQKVIQIEERNEKSKAFDMKKIDLLPEDIVRYIHDFLMPETRIVLLRARYPNLDACVLKLRVPVLKMFSETIRLKYYSPMIQGLYKYNREKCLPPGFFLRFGFSNKNGFMYNINKFIGSCQEAIPHRPQDYRYFQKKALRIIMALIYVSKKLGKLEKPYAPELEVPKTKKPRKKREKKNT
jgi:hypothetical protein